MISKYAKMSFIKTSISSKTEGIQFLCDLVLNKLGTIVSFVTCSLYIHETILIFISLILFQRDDVKTIPRFLIPVLKALNKESERLKKNLLDWCEVLPVVKKTVLKHADEDISGLQVLQMCFLLNNLGMVRDKFFSACL